MKSLHDTKNRMAITCQTPPQSFPSKKKLKENARLRSYNIVESVKTSDARFSIDFFWIVRSNRSIGYRLQSIVYLYYFMISIYNRICPVGRLCERNMLPKITLRIIWSENCPPSQIRNCSSLYLNLKFVLRRKCSVWTRSG